MKTLAFELDDVVEFFEQSYHERAAQQMARSALLELVRTGQLGAGRAAELLCMHLTEFVELMAAHRIPYFTEASDDFDAFYEHWKAQRGK